MSNSDIQKILSGEARLPSMPVVAARLVELREQPDVSLEDISKIVAMDVSLSGTLLRYANSPAYTLGNKVETIERAVIIMGFKAVMDIALSFSLVKAMSDQAGPCLNYNQFWKRSLIAAAAARELGKTQREKYLEELFLAGLLQDIGMLALDRVRPELYRKLGADQSNHEQVCATESADLKFDHAKFGAALLQKWGLHERTIAAVIGSHADQSQSEDSFTACVAASGVIADFFIAGGGQAAYKEVSTTLYRYFSVRDSQCMQLLMDIDAAIHDVSSLFASVVQSTGEIHFVLGDESPIATSPREKPSKAFSDMCRSTYLEDEGDLDGIMSQKAFENSLKNSFKMLRGQPISVVFVSINNLRELEANHGRKVASLLLRVVSRKLQEQIRVEDFVSRYGDTFAIILLGSSLENATNVMERISELFREARYAVADGGKVALSVNGGVAGSSGALHFDSESSLLDAAADALNSARYNGDYCVEAHGPDYRMIALVG